MQGNKRGKIKVMIITHRLWYCKDDKASGKPIIIQDLIKGTTKNTNKIDMKNVNIRMAFNNSKGKAKSSGATTILEIYR